jgi:cytochrome c553
MSTTYLALAALMVGAPLETLGEDLFEKSIRPLLAEKCQGCHGEKKASGGLRLLNRESLLRGGDSGPALVPGKPGESLLLKAVEYRGDLRMPPRGKLTEAEVEKLRRWIALGAPWPGKPRGIAGSGDGRFSEEQKRWWAFQPILAKPPPLTPGAESGVDAFILAKLRQRGETPAGAAGRRQLIRRVTFGLTGLPPTPEEVEAFVNDPAPDAYEKVVDRLLASPSHGERMGRLWLDVARYADFHDPDPKARTASCEPLHAWRYRDWVVRSLNQDLPFDDFIRHQVAGDLLKCPQGGEVYPDGLVATGFLSNGAWDRGDADKEKMVSDMVDDQIDTIGKAFLGMTLGCARCHDHKYDPVTQKDYYALAGVFYSTRILEDLGTKGGEYTLKRAPLVSRAYLARREAVLRSQEAVQDRIARARNTPLRFTSSSEEVQRLERMRRALLPLLPPEPPVTEVAVEGGTPRGLFPRIGDVPLHVRGSYTRLGPVIPRRIPEVFGGLDRPAITRGSGRREVADWLADRSNPLTARVIVNRVWQWHFGLGLVRTANNFGLTSEPPSHPELLDWLTARFLEDGWSLKALHRRIVLSAAYRREAGATREDPENRWLGHFTSRRLEAEAIRDALFRAAGVRDSTLGGPASADPQVPRRSLYVQTCRWDRGGFAQLFDAANPDASVESRGVSITSPQALYLLNNRLVLDLAGQLAARLEREASTDEERIQRAFHLLYSRPPTSKEAGLVRELLAKGGRSAWREAAHVLLLSNEMIFLD